MILCSLTVKINKRQHVTHCVNAVSWRYSRCFLLQQITQRLVPRQIVNSSSSEPFSRLCWWLCCCCCWQSFTAGKLGGEQQQLVSTQVEMWLPQERIQRAEWQKKWRVCLKLVAEIVKQSISHHASTSVLCIFACFLIHVVSHVYK